MTDILFIGPVMLSRHRVGAVDRISLGAPLPILSPRNEIVRRGDPSNVAANIAATVERLSFSERVVSPGLVNEASPPNIVDYVVKAVWEASPTRVTPCGVPYLSNRPCNTRSLHNCESLCRHYGLSFNT